MAHQERRVAWDKRHSHRTGEKLGMNHNVSVRNRRELTVNDAGG